jgi:hypothetical protein
MPRLRKKSASSCVQGEAFHFEDEPIEQKHMGHLHCSPELAKGDAVPGADLPKN